MKRRKNTNTRRREAAVSALAQAATPLTHIDQRGQARMVDVTEKGASERIAVAEGRIIMRKETLDLVLEGNALKGDVLGAA
ncbi:MAG: cyclic pyranopterin monophosphate synthase MoaC, partial [Pseudolabrys sp.]